MVKPEVEVSPPPPPPPPPPMPKRRQEPKFTPKPTPKPIPNPIRNKPVQLPRPKAKPEHEELFEQPEARELSDRLSSLPIRDLHKSMGLNERVFTINELFGGDQNAFNLTLDMLNSFSNFEQAKAYLSENIADQYNWASKRKRAKAKSFVKLVRRRYV